jgi:putative transposase
VKIAGKKHWVWRAVDQDGLVLDILVQSRRDKRLPNGSCTSC